MDTEISITTENVIRVVLYTAADAKAARKSGTTHYCPATNEPAKVGDVMGSTRSTRISVVHPDGHVLHSRTVRRHPLTVKNATAQLVNQVLFEHEELTFCGQNWQRPRCGLQATAAEWQANPPAYVQNCLHCEIRLSDPTACPESQDVNTDPQRDYP